MEMQDAKQARPHCELIDELWDSRQPKTEREHAAAREIERLREALHRISLTSRNSMSTKTECGAIARKALLDEGLSASNAKVTGSYSLHRIAWELAQTASGDAYYSNALRVAKDLPGLCDTDRALLDRYATGNQAGTDHVALCDLAVRINALQKEPAP